MQRAQLEVMDKHQAVMKYIKLKFKIVLAESIVVSLGKIISALGSLYLVYILTNYLSPEQYGILNLAMTFSIAVNQLLTGPLGAGTTRFYAASVEHNQSKSFFRSIFRLLKSTNFMIVGFGLVTMLIITGTDTSISWQWLIIVMILFSIISSYSSIFNGIFLAAKMQTITSVAQGAEPWIKAICAVGLILFFGTEGLVALIGYVFGIIIVLIFQFIFIKKLIHENVAKGSETIKWDKKILDYSLPFVIWGSFTAVYLISDRWALQFFVSTEEVGMYSVLYQIGYFPIILIIGILVQVITPYFYKKAGIGNDSSRMIQIQKSGMYLIGISLVLTVFITLVTFFLQDMIFEYIISKEYGRVAYLLPYMTIAAGLFATGQVANMILLSEVKTKILIKPKIYTSLIGILLNMLGAYFYGISGVVIGMILYSIVFLIWIIWLTFQDKFEGWK